MDEEDDWPPHDNRTKEEVRLHWLRERLAQPRWNFSLTYHSFDGFSEGVCLLGGIDPTESEQAEGQYGPDFLPGGLAMHWTGPYPKWADAWQLRYSVHEGLSRYAALGLKGLGPVRDAIMAATKAGLDLPWLGAANDDFECARRLPPSLVTNEAIWKQVRSRHATTAGRSRAEKDAKTSFLREHVKPIFGAMAATGFSDDFRAASTKRLMPRRVADAIFHEVTGGSQLSKKAPAALKAVVQEARAYLADNPRALPTQAAFWDNVGQWLKAHEKSSQQKKQ